MDRHSNGQLAMPQYVKDLLPCFIAEIEASSEEQTLFSRPFLSKVMGGSQFPTRVPVKFDSQQRNLRPLQHLMTIDCYMCQFYSYTPRNILPIQSGRHGAALVGYQHPCIESKPIPLFVKRDQEGFQYMGEYTLRGGRHLEIGEYNSLRNRGLLKSWSEPFTKGREWITEAYELAALSTPERRTRTVEEVDRMWGSELNLYWVYLKCVGYNRKLYDNLESYKVHGHVLDDEYVPKSKFKQYKFVLTHESK